MRKTRTVGAYSQPAQQHLSFARRGIAPLAAGIVAVMAAFPRAQGAEPVAASAPWDTQADTWTAADALGRVVPGFGEVGPPRKERTVGIFYFLWLGAHAQGGPYDVTKILAADPAAMLKGTSPPWGPLHVPHHWGESLLGYYRTDDEHVLRRHAQMLTDAGVDVAIFDVTNQWTYRHEYRTLLEVWAKVRAAGGKTPQVAFLCPFGEPARVVRELYADLYKPRFHPELWFHWDGKPLILADPDLIAPTVGFSTTKMCVALSPGHTLGQSFRAEKPFDTVAGSFANWATRGAGMTLVLYRGGPLGEPVARRRCADVADNSWEAIRLEKPLPAGEYYLEMSQPAGQIGWWSDAKDTWREGRALADRAPADGDRALRYTPVDDPLAGLRNFFTFRKPQPDYFQGPTRPDMWSWLEVHPQHVFKNARGEKEQMSVGVAQNAIGPKLGSMSEPGARGRSYHAGATDRGSDAILHGYNVAEQWKRALAEDPRFVFVTGWNEWIAGRFAEFAGYRAPVIFVDQFDHEHSRDIEPMRGGHGDNYYYQLVSNVRRYKGVRRPPTAGPATTIRLDGNFSQWTAVTPEFRDDIGDAVRRDHPAYAGFTRYVNATGRNDFVAAKVARDARLVWFYVRTAAPITPPAGPLWMTLWIDIDGRRATGWEGYDFVVNRVVPSATNAVLEVWSAAGWQRRGAVQFRVHANELMLAIPRSLLNLPEGDAPVRLDFKWTDNIQKDNDIDAFTLYGDAAPNARFNYRYATP